VLALAVWLLGAGTALLAAGGAQPGVVGDAAAHQAIVDAIRSRMGHDVEVRVEALRVGGRPSSAGTEGALVATPEPGARLGRQIRFSLSRAGASRPAPAGYAVAAVFVEAEHVRAARSLAQGETLAEEDLVTNRSEVGAVLVQRLPRVMDLAGTRVLRDVAADEVMTRNLVAVRPMVRAGDVVALTARGDGVVVRTEGVATQSGEAGDAIRIVNPASRRTVKGRVVAPGTVEVIQ
jgi:flagella basal body P-ring formation protein FlgA